MTDYERAATRIRETLSHDPDLKALIRYATLAANGHNTQPWRFSVSDDRIGILPDFARRTPIVDPDDHHLFVSLGCAAENLLIAAGAHGRPGAIATRSGEEAMIEIDLARASTQTSALYEAIPKRQSTRADYDGRSLSADDLRRLENAAAIDGVSLVFILDRDRRETVLDFVTLGNDAQMDDPAFVSELKQWIRFSASSAVDRGDGLFAACTGNPTVPTWLGNILFDWVFDKASERDRYARQLRSSAGIAVFVGDRQDSDGWINVGRSFQRFALQATALGIRHAHVNQPVEVPAVRADIARWLDIGDARPDLMIRFGYAPPMPMSLRRPVDDVIIAGR